MKLNTIEKFGKKSKVGRGIGSGTGNFWCRHKGQKSRSGVAIKGFEESNASSQKASKEVLQIF